MPKYELFDSCIHLQKISLRENPPDENTIFPMIRYKCDLHNKTCIGSEYGIFIWSSDTLNPKRINECPSRR